MASIDDDQPAAEKTRSKPDKATTEAALRGSPTRPSIATFDAVEVPGRRHRAQAGADADKRTAPLRITLNAKRFGSRGPG